MDGTGRLCQALAVRLHKGADTERLRARLESRGGGARL